MSKKVTLVFYINGKMITSKREINDDKIIAQEYFYNGSVIINN